MFNHQMTKCCSLFSFVFFFYYWTCWNGCSTTVAPQYVEWKKKKKKTLHTWRKPREIHSRIRSSWCYFINLCFSLSLYSYLLNCCPFILLTRLFLCAPFSLCYLSISTKGMRIVFYVTIWLRFDSLPYEKLQSAPCIAEHMHEVGKHF